MEQAQDDDETSSIRDWRLRNKSFRELMEPDKVKHDSFEEKIKTKQDFIFKRSDKLTVPLSDQEYDMNNDDKDSLNSSMYDFGKLEE